MGRIYIDDADNRRHPVYARGHTAADGLGSGEASAVSEGIWNPLSLDEETRASFRLVNAQRVTKFVCVLMGKS